MNDLDECTQWVPLSHEILNQTNLSPGACALCGVHLLAHPGFFNGPEATP